MDITTNITTTKTSSVREKHEVKQSGSVDPLFIAWYLILQDVAINQETIRLHADDLRANNKAQDILNNDINSIQLNAIPAYKQIVIGGEITIQIGNASTTLDFPGEHETINLNASQVAAIQDSNQQQLKIQSGDESEVVLLRQKFQVASTSADNENNNLNALVQEGASLSSEIAQVSLRIENKQNLG